MIDFDEIPCPKCGHNDKVIKETPDEWFYVLCNRCSYKTPKFRYVVSAQSNFVEYRERKLE